MKIYYFIIALFVSNMLCAQDPNFHIYICFGQSNMEGQGTIETVDKTVDSRFKVMQAVNCTNPTKTMGTWYTATPPTCRCATGISPVDNFGKTLVANLPSNVTVGVIHVAVAGCKIELYDKVNYASYSAGVEQWMKNIINEYGGNPYGRIVDLAKLAQKDGVIKGILIHQGESNTGDTQWPTKVKGVYDNLIKDLGLQASQVPLLAGEVVGSDQGGQCASMNSIIATLPNIIPNSYVISSYGCTDQSDNLHFTSAGYRLLGQRYAEKMLTLLPANNAPVVSVTLPTNNASFEAPASITITASASDPNNDLTKVEFYNGTTKLGEKTTAPYSYAWTNVAQGTYSITAIASDAAGNKTTSAAVSVSVITPFAINKTANPIVIDGTIDALWTNSSVLPISATKLLSGTVTNAADLSGSCKALWDNSYLYILAEISDEVLNNDSQNIYDDDAVEIYVDIQNDKATTYGTNDVQYTFAWNDGTTVGSLPSGRATTGITYSAVAKTGGYIVEARIPWTTLQGTPAVGQYIGFDFMINDDDNAGTRDGKLSWNAATDDAWQNPSLIGTAILRDIATCTPPAPPTATATICYTQGSTASALSATGTNLLWYTVATGGTASSSAPIPSTTTVGTTNYYVSQTVNGCESSRTIITVTITDTPTQTVQLKAGWNLIGCPISGSTPIETALVSIWQNVEQVKNMDSFYDTNSNPALNSLLTVQWGYAYLVKVIAPCELTW